MNLLTIKLKILKNWRFSTHNGFHKTFWKSTFYCHNPKGLKLITNLGLRLINLRFNKFDLDFPYKLNSTSNCGII